MTTTGQIARIAVVLPVYNGEKYLAGAVRSVLDQTFTDFELVVVDDGSTDRTAEILAGCSDSRLRVIRFPENRGIVAALNAGIRECRSEIIARFDADDIAHPRRLEKQVAFLDGHPEVSICGTWVRLFGLEHGEERLPADHESIAAGMFFTGTLSHPTVMMRRRFLVDHDLTYTEAYKHAEDYDLFLRAVQLTRVANLPEFLHQSRIHERSVCTVHRQNQKESTQRLFLRELHALLPNATRKEEAFHVGLLTGAPYSLPEFGQLENWLLRLDRANRQVRRYDVHCFRSELCRRWYAAHRRTAFIGIAVLASYWSSPLASLRYIDPSALIALAVRCTWKGAAPAWWRRCMEFLNRPWYAAAFPPSKSEKLGRGNRLLPRVAVILPVYNGARYIGEAVQSVLDQTFDDFEVVVVDDGSTDQTVEVLAGFSDARLRVIRLPHAGLVQALNTGIRESESELIARMDADDVCVPERFERQVAFLDAHPEVGLCGTWSRQFGDSCTVLRPPVDPERIRARLFFGWAIEHPSIMARRAVLERHGLSYDERFRHVEDFDFFVRAAEMTSLANVPEILLHTRAHGEEVSVVHRKEQQVTEGHLLKHQLRALLPDVTAEEEDFHIRMLASAIDPTDLARAGQWLLHLTRANRTNARYDRNAFEYEVHQKWFDLHSQVSPLAFGLLLSYWNSPLASIRGIGLQNHLRLIASCCLSRRTGWRRACIQYLERRRVEKFRQEV